MSDLHCLGDLLGGTGNHHDLRVARSLRAVVFEDDQVLGGVEDVLLPHHRDEFVNYFLRDHFKFTLRLNPPHLGQCHF